MGGINTNKEKKAFYSFQINAICFCNILRYAPKRINLYFYTTYYLSQNIQEHIQTKQKTEEDQNWNVMKRMALM